MADDVEVIANFSEWQRRTPIRKDGSKGKARITMKISSEPVLINTDAKVLGAGPAQEMAKVLRERVEQVSEAASPGTMRARLSALKALTLGKPWAQRRYGGGKLGTMPPARSDRSLNDSGRLAKSIVAAPVKDGWIVNIAANRLDASTIGESGVVRVMTKLRDLVPEFGDTRLLFDNLGVRRALQEGLDQAIQKASERGVALRKQLMGRAWSLVQQVARMAG